jgi:hypothetical protein
MARFTVDALNHLIADNRKRLVEIAGGASGTSPLMARVAQQLELSVKILERQRDELLASKARGV